ncbi:DUF721 domain-containing protein [Aestuariibius sp. 2305UL40-4]|uniref:DUF721 domain-containing protein n=1 Tax=Aestuariibius violaceus TaxID=3234132 RepID=UPI00398EA3E6
MAPMAGKRQSMTRGFTRAAGLVSGQIRSAAESRGFAVSRLLTHWPEIVGPRIAGMAEPVKMTYGRAEVGGTLTILVKGSLAPMVEMEKEKIRDRVNACYGYGAIRKINITQTAPHGFAEAAAPFQRAPLTPPAPDPKSQEIAAPVTDPGLRAALEKLGANVLAKGSKRR